MPEDIAANIYGSQSTVTGGVFAPMGTAQTSGDNYLVNGHWRWASGSQNCHWLNGGCIITENGTPTQRAVIFPAEKAELIDTWHTMGLRGTGSGDMKVTNLQVIKEYSVSLLTDKLRAEGALYAFPAFGLLAMGIAAVACGNALAALDEFQQDSSQLKAGGARKSLSDRAVVQSDFAQATAELRSARAFLINELGQSWESATAQGEIALTRRAGLRLAATHQMFGSHSRFGKSDLRRLRASLKVLADRARVALGCTAQFDDYGVAGRSAQDHAAPVTASQVKPNPSAKR